MGVVFIPLYLRLLGPEPFALVGILLSLQSISLILDFGLAAALNRELSHRSGLVDPRDRQHTRDLVKTIERLTWCIASSIGLALALAGPSTAAYWLHAEILRPDQIATALLIIAAAVALSWPTTIYTGALQGLERHIPLNIANAMFATLRSAGVIQLMLFPALGLNAFLAWQAIVGLAHSLVLAQMLRRYLPQKERADSHHVRLDSMTGFAWGMFGLSASAVLLSQLDRFVIAGTRPLEELGYYGVAVSLAAGLGRMVSPMFSAVYPRFARLLTIGDKGAIAKLHRDATQWLAAIVAATTAIMLLFARDVLYLWSGDAALADRISQPMMLLVFGSALNGLVNVSYALQLAAGWIRFSLLLNLTALAIAVPYCFYATERFGMPGAATTWLAVNALYFVAIPWFVSRRCEGIEIAHWYWRDVLPPVVAAFAAAALARQVLPPADRTLEACLLLFLASSCTLAVSCFAVPAARAMFLNASQILRPR